MNEKIETPQVQSMENPVWQNESLETEKKVGKKFMSKKMLLILGGILLFLLLTLLTTHLQRKENLTVEPTSPKLISPSPTPTLEPEEENSNLKEGINESRKDLENVNLFDDSFHPPSIDESIKL